MPSLPEREEPETPTQQRVRILGYRATKAIAGDQPADTRAIVLTVLAVAGASRARGLWGVIGSVTAALLGLDLISRRRYDRQNAGKLQDAGR